MLAFCPTLHSGDDVIHITVNMGEDLGCGGEGGMDMVIYARTRISVSTREFSASVNVYSKLQNNLVDSTHPIGRTISIQIMMQ